MTDSPDSTSQFRAFGTLSGTLHFLQHTRSTFELDDGRVLFVTDFHPRLRYWLIDHPDAFAGSRSWRVYPRIDATGTLSKISLKSLSPDPLPTHFTIAGQIAYHEPGKVVVCVCPNEPTPEGQEEHWRWKPFFLTLQGDPPQIRYRQFWQFERDLVGEKLQIQSAVKLVDAPARERRRSAPVTPTDLVANPRQDRSAIADPITRAKPDKEESEIAVPQEAPPLTPSPAVEPPNHKKADLSVSASEPTKVQSGKEAGSRSTVQQSESSQSKTTKSSSRETAKPTAPAKSQVKANHRVFGGQTSVQLKGGMLQIDDKQIAVAKVAIVVGELKRVEADGAVQRIADQIVLTGR
jgi:hypothetical protein